MGVWNWPDWLLACVLSLWALRVSYRFGVETGKDDAVERFRADPDQALRNFEAERAAEGPFRRWARGRHAQPSSQRQDRN